MQPHVKFPLHRAAIDPQLDFCRDRLECSRVAPAYGFEGNSISAQIAMLASLLAYFSQLNR